MWRVIGSQDRERSISDPFHQRIDICLRSQWRIHFEFRIEILNGFVGQGDVMRANFAADFHAARPCLTQQPYAAYSRDMLTMNMMIAKFRE